MNHNYDWILYSGSPFLPLVNQININNVLGYTQGSFLLYSAIATEVAFIGISQKERHEQEFESLKYVYNLDAVNFVHMFHGFVAPAQVIIGLDILTTHPLEYALKLIQNITEEYLLTELNKYKKELLLIAREKYLLLQDKSPASIATLVFDLCKQKPFVSDQNFLIGLEAGERTYFQILNSLPTGSKMPTNPPS